jgi:hypothetical protein
MLASVHTVQHPSCGRRQLRCGVVGGAWLMAGVAVAAVACGDVHFVPAPFTPESVQVVYSAQEDVSIIRWRVSAADPLPDTQFQLDGPDGFQPIDFARSVFPGGVTPCTDKAGGACAQYVVRGVYDLAGRSHPVRAVHSRYGLLPGGPAKARTVDTTLAIASFFGPRNDFVYATLADTVASDGPYSFPRPYERAMWPAAGLCVSNIWPDGVTFSPLGDKGGFAPDAALTDDGTYCVAARPQSADGTPGVVVQARVATVPVVKTAEVTYVPPVEKAPVLYQIILDLEIPVPDRCTAAIDSIEALLRKHMKGGGVPVYQLPTINLAGGAGSPGCAQQSNREFPATAVAQAVKDLIATLPETHQRYHLIYFNNLHAPLPGTLVSSFQALAAAMSSPPGYDLQMVSWLFNPGEALVSDVTWTKVATWVSTDDPAFEQTIQMYTEPTLPFTTELDIFPIAFLPAEDVAQHAGKLVKICSSSPQVYPVSSDGLTRIQDPSWTIDPGAPPSYWVGLNPQVAVPTSAFVSNQVTVAYQLCDRYCTNHPFLTDAGMGVTSWTESPLCASKDY